MKKIFLVLLSASITTFCLAQTEAEMKKWEAFMTPGDIHKMLAKSAGEWTSETTMWMAPGAPPTKSSGTAKQEMILGGRYLQGIHKGDFMGMPFEGISITGYDNVKKKFYNTWVDNMGTGFMNLIGTWNAKTKSITFTGVCTDPTTGKDCKVKEIFTMVDDNTQKMEMWMEQKGKMFKTMELTATRTN